jgi:hypothetical protein
MSHYYLILLASIANVTLANYDTLSTAIVNGINIFTADQPRQSFFYPISADNRYCNNTEHGRRKNKLLDIQPLDTSTIRRVGISANPMSKFLLPY